MKQFLYVLFFMILSPVAVAQTSQPTVNTDDLKKAQQMAAQEEYERKLMMAPLNHKDSIDYTLDDGKMSKEEMQLEAEYIFGLCSRNAYQSLYFNCACLSGAFLLERERLGPTTPQSTIMQTLTQSEKAKCANVESMANQSFKNCMFYSTTYRQFSTDHNEVCQCAANRAANKFSDRPWLESSYVRSLNTEAISHCLSPENRAADLAKKKAERAQNAATIKTQTIQ